MRAQYTGFLLGQEASEQRTLWLTTQEVSHAPKKMGCQDKGHDRDQGLQGKSVADICHEHQISQSQYDQWRDQFLVHAGKAFEVLQQSQKEARLVWENAKLKTLVGELT